MNTLKFKALFSKVIFILFIRAVGIYLLMTLPALGVPLVYIISAMYAVSFGWIAGIIFLLFIYLLQKIKAGILIKKFFLYAAVPIAVLVAFQMMEVTGVQRHIWNSGFYLLFPAIAIIAGWISTVLSWRKVYSLFIADDINDNTTTPDNNFSPT
jgi:hypothetical protein